MLVDVSGAEAGDAALLISLCLYIIINLFIPGLLQANVLQAVEQVTTAFAAAVSAGTLLLLAAYRLLITNWFTVLGLGTSFGAPLFHGTISGGAGSEYYL